ncbi:MAG: DUF308 domain-containing protein [Bacteroidales bacterium]|nr:DUF308 domain-containing protein [Bacteroidales bacterium]
MKTIQNKWSGLAIIGAIALLIGLVFIFLPHQFVETIVKVLGILLTIGGAGMLVYSYLHKNAKGSTNIYFLFQGFLNLAIGIVMITKPAQMINFILFIIGLWAVVTGIYQIIYAIKVWHIVNFGMFLLGNGIAFLGIGLVMLVNPTAILETMLVVFGIVIALLGLILLYFSYLMFKTLKTKNVEFIELDSK